MVRCQHIGFTQQIMKFFLASIIPLEVMIVLILMQM